MRWWHGRAAVLVVVALGFGWLADAWAGKDDGNGLAGRVAALEAALEAETAARVAADSALQQALAAQVTARQSGDEDLEADLAAEASARAAADTELEADVAANELAINDNETDLATNATYIETNIADIAALQAQFDGHASQQEGLQQEVADLQPRVAENETAVGIQANAVSDLQVSTEHDLLHLHEITIKEAMKGGGDEWGIPGSVEPDLSPPHRYGDTLLNQSTSTWATLNRSDEEWFTILDWTPELWDSRHEPGAVWPSPFSTYFPDLTCLQREAVRHLGYTAVDWDSSVQRLLMEGGAWGP